MGAARADAEAVLGSYERCVLLGHVEVLRMLSTLFYVGLDAVGIPRAARLLRRAGTILCYHNVVTDGGAGESATPDVHMPLARFEAQVRWLAWHCEIVPLRELVQRVERGEQRSTKIVGASVVLDDGTVDLGPGRLRPDENAVVGRVIDD